MPLTRFLEYNISSDTINSTHINNKFACLLESKTEFVAVSVSPALIESVGVAIGDLDITISSVLRCGTYIEVLMLECAMAIENGAEEIEVIVDLNGAEIDEIYEIKGELAILKDEIEADALLKVDISLNNLTSEDQTQDIVSNICSSGADFIVLNLANLENTKILEFALTEIKKESLKQGRQIGVKYKCTVNEEEIISLTEKILGRAWLTPDLLRIERTFSTI
ncbi:MAG: hypothetical protein R3Y51_05905 [Rikenellaceae bacterium]